MSRRWDWISNLSDSSCSKARGGLNFTNVSKNWKGGLSAWMLTGWGQGRRIWQGRFQMSTYIIDKEVEPLLKILMILNWDVGLCRYRWLWLVQHMHTCMQTFYVYTYAYMCMYDWCRHQYPCQSSRKDACRTLLSDRGQHLSVLPSRPTLYLQKSLEKSCQQLTFG